MKRTIHTLAYVACVAVLTAQSYVHQVVVLNEGYYDMSTQTQVEPVKLGTYDPAMASYQHMVTITGPRFASDVEVGTDGIYVAADDQLLKYDRDNFQLLGQATIVGIRKIALWNGQVLVTRGELGGLPHYFEARNASDLSLNYYLDTTTGPAYSCEDVEVHGDTAYLAVSNAFDWANLVGKIGRVDLVAQSYSGEVDLGPDGLNPENIMIANDALYVLNNKDFTGSSISKLSHGANVIDFTDNVALNSGCGSSVMAEEKIYFQEYSVNQLARYDLQNGAVLDTLNTSSYYGLIDDPQNQVLYATSTDFFSSGTLHVLAYNGTELSQTPVGISAGNMALDVRSTVGVNESHVPSFTVFPNPASDVIRIVGAVSQVELTDAAGRTVLAEQLWNGSTLILDVAHLPAGLYHLRMDEVTQPVMVARN